MSSAATVTTVSSLEAPQSQPQTWKLHGANQNFDTLPETLPASFMGEFEKLSPSQAGYIRHFHNLVSQADGQWALMGSQEPGQEWVDAYRYQLATMAYAVGAAHYHRLPALRSVFKTLLERIIHKMMRRDVWGYWYLTSQSGIFVDPDLKELRKPWADPVVRENIMYSGHLILMVSLHAMLFDDDKYDQEGALTFHHNPMFWGMGPESFSYTRTSLQNAIIKEMEREKWLGVCCEPNSIFVVCNQFPFIAMRYNDVRDGTEIIDRVLEKYTAAWKAKGMVGADGMFVHSYSPKRGNVRPSMSLGVTAWASAFMNAWNPSLVHSTFRTQSIGNLSRVEENRVNLNSAVVARFIQDLVINENADPNSTETLKKAREFEKKTKTTPRMPYSEPEFGYAAMWVSEVGDNALLNGLMTHADRFLSPTWLQGGLYYPTNVQACDEEGNWTCMEPFTGNSAIAYASLNVFDGQRKMWLQPWTREYVERKPVVDGVGLGSDVDFLRGAWDDERGAMVITVKSWDGGKKMIKPRVCNLKPGRYGVYLNGNLSESRILASSKESIELELEVDGSELDVVLLKA